MEIDFYQQATLLRPAMVERRQDFHRHPELAFEEVRTAGIVAARLLELGLEVQTGVGKTGVVGLLETGQPGPTLLVRADMDALPIQEANETGYVSQTPGKMHACGHDGHTSIGLAVAEILSKHKDALRGRVKFVFQPAEEIGEGASAMVKDGVLENPRPDYTIGLHLWNDLPVGKVAVTPGPAMAASDIWECVITGHGGHGAAPHQTRDPIVATAQIINALQTIVSRNVHPLDTAVVSVGTIKGGDVFNVIPACVEMTGTVRTYKKDTKRLVHERLTTLIEGIAAACQCDASVEIAEMTLAVDNDRELSEQIAAIAADIVGNANVVRDERTMGAEDVSFLMEDIPGCYFFIGSSNPARDLHYPHHNPRFDFDEEALVIGAAVLAKAAASILGVDAQPSD
nr:amidohydrolase [Anaerolineae bacterium]